MRPKQPLAHTITKESPNFLGMLSGQGMPQCVLYINQMCPGKSSDRSIVIFLTVLVELENK